METWNPEKSGRRWKICMYGRCFESESGLERGQVKRGGLRSECWDGQLLSVGEGVTGAGDKVWLLLTGGFRGGCVEEWMLKVHERARVRREF